MNVIWTYYIHIGIHIGYVTNQHLLRHFTAIHKSSPMALWDSEIPLTFYEYCECRHTTHIVFAY